MAKEDPAKPAEGKNQQKDPDRDSGDNEEEIEKKSVSPEQSSSSSDSESESDSEYESESENDPDASSEEETFTYTRPGDEPAVEDSDTPEDNVRRFMKLLNSKRLKKLDEEEETDVKSPAELFDFPKDPDNCREEHLKELWADAPLGMTKPGWDPVFADEDDWEVMREEAREGRDPPIAPFYLPYRKPYPVIPDNHFDISNPKEVIEELDRIEEFMTWVSFIFEDGSSYEGTVWDDLAHGKGVYVADNDMIRYEGEWFQNEMEGHGIIEIDIPEDEPIPGSKHEAQMRAEGHILSRDNMSPDDRKWLEMDIEDSIKLAGGFKVIPWYESDWWIEQFGKKPEKGHYRYAGQWKHGRMHGCGIYEVNRQITYGRFYFGERVEDEYGCDDYLSGFHAGIAEVAAAKARMFINKPDGMVREERGPYCDPQHPYLYEEDDMWMAPGFMNQFFEVPDYWQAYVKDVDEEREMWLNSFYLSPLRIPGPAELEYLWETKEDFPEFILVNEEPVPDPKDPSKLVYAHEPLFLHTPTERLINYREDEKYGIRLFWQPDLKEGEKLDLSKVEYLPLGFDETELEADPLEKTIWIRIAKALDNVCQPILKKFGSWVEEKKKAYEIRKVEIEKEKELLEAELKLEEARDELEELLRMKEEEMEEEEDEVNEEDKSLVRGVNEKEDKDKDEDEEEEDDDDDDAPSFGSATTEELKKENQKKKSWKSPFAASSLSFLPRSSVGTKLQGLFLPWRDGGSGDRAMRLSASQVHYSLAAGWKGISTRQPAPMKVRAKDSGTAVQIRSLARLLVHSSSSQL